MTPEVLALFILNSLFLIFSTIAFFIALQISRNYDSCATTSGQYLLEKRSYLGATIIKYIFAIKLPLFIFFIFTLDKISYILPGAMCATGVVNATDYGIYLLLLKLVNLYFFSYWIMLNAVDMKSETQPHIKTKFQLFIPMFLLLILEIVVEFMMFFSIDVKSVVDCCGVVFSSSDGTYIAQMIGAPHWMQAGMLYGVFMLMGVAYLRECRRIYSLVNLLFIFVALVTLIGFFGLYIYEMPTHHCPFCFLAHEYNYIGYLLYIFLFLGTFYGMTIGIMEFKKEEEKKYYRISLLFNTAYIIIVSSYVLLYYIKNSLWL